MEAGRCQDESFCPAESSCPGEVRSEDGVRFQGEPLSGDTGHSQDEAHFPCQTYSVDEAPRDVVLSYAARFPRDACYFLVCSQGEESACRFVMERRDCQAVRTVLQHDRPRRPRVH